MSTTNSGDPKSRGFTINTDYEDPADGTTGRNTHGKFVYTPNDNDPAHTGSESACDVEHFSITYINGPVVQSAALRPPR